VAVARAAEGSAAVLAAQILDPDGAADTACAAGAAWSLARSGQPVLARAALDDARRDARRLSIAAFPAIAHATLVRDPHGSEFSKRLRLTWAVLRGRI
jgi:phytoene synthase